jgi:hypothetical protein
MSFLYPLFLAGAAAVALPIVLHLIRRHTRKRVTFSSLMFLHTTAPRFKSRSRLEHISLLVLRCLVLCLLAFAFARPFLRRPALADNARPGKRTVLLVDASASMRRAGLWARTIDEARLVLEDAGPSDRVCVMSFDRDTHTLIGFEQWATMDPARRASIANQELSRLAPGWAFTNVGHALVTAAEAIEDDEANDEQGTLGERRVALISDLQRGSNLEGLLAYEWPERTELIVRAIPCRGTTNASLQLVTSRDYPASFGRGDLPDIRVSNSPDADKDRFRLSWAAEAGADAPGGTMDIYVPPGHSVVLRPPALPNRPAAAKLVLGGDDHDFDNALYLAPRLQQQVNVLYVGSDDPNDTRQMLYYLRQVFGADEIRAARVISRPGSEPFGAGEVETAHLVIVADTLNQQNIPPLRRHLESGGTLLLVMRSAETRALSELAGMDGLDAQEAEVGTYAMLDRIEFSHPWLKPFSDPRFGDFTRIHFWKYRRIDIAAWSQAKVLAWFDSGDPAWLELPVGTGVLLVWTSGWHPSDSDLALSSKFVPLLHSALEYGGTPAQRQSQYFVGDPVPLPSGSPDLQIRKPDGSIAHPDAGRQTFTQTDMPGIYTVIAPAGDRPFAVNLPPGESRTEPMPIEDFEKLGVSLQPVSDIDAAQPSAAGITTESGGGPSRAAHSSFTEMESEQKLWRWVLAATFALLLIEIWLAGWLGTPKHEAGRLGTPLTRPGPVSEGEQV